MQDSKAASSKNVPQVRGFSAWPWYFRFFHDPLACLCQAQRRFGSIFSLGTPLPFGPSRRQFVCLLSPEGNRQVLGDAHTFRPSSVSVRGPAGSGLNRLRSGFNTGADEQGLQLRKIVLPPFARKAVQGYHSDIVSITNQVIGSWPERQPIEMWTQMRTLSLRLSCQLLFGRESTERACALGELLQEFMRRSYFSPALWLPVSFPGSPYRALLQNAERVAQTIDAMVAERRAATAGRTDVLEMLVRTCPAESLPNLVGPASFLFVASFETIANALTWTVFLLAQHPRFMADLFDEVQETLHGDAPTMEQIDRLPLLDAAIKESMRLLPPVPITYRVVTRAVDLDTLSLAKGDRVVCSQYVTHHSPELFPEPDRFLPRRWFSIEPSQYEYFPFGAGAHLCIGYTLGMTILKVSLAMILQRWRLAVVPQARIDRSIQFTLSPKHGLPMIAHAQDGRFQATTVRGNIHEMVDFTDVGGDSLPLRAPAPPTSLRHGAGSTSSNQEAA